VSHGPRIAGLKSRPPLRVALGTTLTERAAWLIGSGFGAGHFPASGTVGTVPGVVIAWLLSPWNVMGSAFAVYAAALGVICVAGAWASTHLEVRLKETDPGLVTVDEIAGMLVTVAFLPTHDWRWLLAGFITFRVFDIVKPWPAFQVQGVRGGWGVMLDDLVAGLYGCALLHLAQRAI